MENLPKEFKDKWIAALRSGEYKQGRTALENNGVFCCLGVACKISDVPTLEYDEETGQHLEIEWIPENTSIPNILIGASEVAEKLSVMNDGNYETPTHSFAEIADYIEENL